MAASTLATRLLYPAHRTNVITARMKERLTAQQARQQQRGLRNALRAAVAALHSLRRQTNLPEVI